MAITQTIQWMMAILTGKPPGFAEKLDIRGREEPRMGEGKVWKSSVSAPPC